MSRFNLRQRPRISYYEPEEPNLDEYVFCTECADFVYEYCAIHGPLLVIPDDKVPAKPNFPAYVPRAALTIPHEFLHLAPSIIPGAGLGVFSTLTLPRGVRFGPYRGQRSQDITSMYCWQIYDRNRKPSHVVDASDGSKSNWMRYVNCARHWHEQNLVAFQYQGQLYYRTIKTIPRFTELMVFYGIEFASSLNIDLRRYNSPSGYAYKLGTLVTKKRKPDEVNKTTSDLNNNKTCEQDTSKYEGNTDNQDAHIKICVFNEECSVRDKSTGCNEQIVQKNNIKTLSHLKNREETCTKKSIEKEENTSTVLIRNETIKHKSFFICNQCDQRFETKSTLISHINTHVTKLLPHSGVCLYCSVCNYQTVTRESLDRHLKMHDKKKRFTCNVCQYKFTFKQHLKSHMRTHTGEKPYSCNLCPYKSSHNISLKIHMSTHTGEKPYSCNLCPYKSSHNISLKIHMRTHTGEKPYSCNLCPYKSAVISNLKNHMSTHTGEKPYSCNLCPFKSAQKIHLKTHMRTHTGEKPYSCNLCPYKSAENSSLKIHMRTHTGEKPYSCNLCPYKSAENSSLKIHMRTHTGEKPYSCNLCPYKSSHNISLKIHMRTHTGEKPYSCNLCPYKSAVISNLKNHMSTHTGEKPYSCNLCPFKSAQKIHLKTHMRTHTGEKPYSCNLCPFKSTQKINLKTHMSTHTEEKPYSCNLCPFKSAQKIHLKTHMRTHTGEKPYSCNL